MRFLFPVLTMIALLSLSSCARQFNSVWVLYEESYCADPWGAEFEDEDEKYKAVKEYMNDNDIRTYTVESGEDIQPSVCNSCECGSGEVLRAKIHEDDRQAAIAAGWYTDIN